MLKLNMLASENSHVAVAHVTSQQASCQGEIEWTRLSPLIRPAAKAALVQGSAANTVSSRYPLLMPAVNARC